MGRLWASSSGWSQGKLFTKLGSSLFNLEGYATKCIYSGKADFGFYNMCVIGILVHVHVCALQILVSLVRYQSLPSIA